MKEVNSIRCGLNPESYEIERYSTLGIIECRHPWLISKVRKARGYTLYERVVRSIQDGKESLRRTLLLAGARQSVYSIKFLGWFMLGLI